MSTLDMPQHIYVCTTCGAPNPVMVAVPGGGSYACGHERVKIEPTLLYADFQAYMTALSLAHAPMPSDADVWDRLESCTDTAPTNREAIDNAIRWVVSQR